MTQDKNPFWSRIPGVTEWTEIQKPKKGPVDPVIKALRKAYKGSKMAEFDKLAADHRKWRRRAVIADNKLMEINRKIFLLARDSIWKLSAHKEGE